MPNEENGGAGMLKPPLVSSADFCGRIQARGRPNTLCPFCSMAASR